MSYGYCLIALRKFKSAKLNGVENNNALYIIAKRPKTEHNLHRFEIAVALLNLSLYLDA